MESWAVDPSATGMPELFLCDQRNKGSGQYVCPRDPTHASLPPGDRILKRTGAGWRLEVANGNGKKKKKRWIIVVASLVGIIVIVLAVTAMTRGGAKIDPSKLAKVEKGDLAKSVVATGKIQPIVKTDIKSKASGIVKKWY